MAQIIRSDGPRSGRGRVGKFGHRIELVGAKHGTRKGFEWGCRCWACCEHYPHGAERYRKLGCRCDACTKANAKHHHDAKQKRRQREPPEHGTFNAYSNYGCKCDPCKAAGAEYRNGYRLRKKREEAARLFELQRQTEIERRKAHDPLLQKLAQRQTVAYRDTVRQGDGRRRHHRARRQ